MNLSEYDISNDSSLHESARHAAIINRAVTDHILHFLITKDTDYCFKSFTLDDICSALVWKYNDIIHAHPLTKEEADYCVAQLTLSVVGADEKDFDITLVPIEQLNNEQREYLQSLSIFDRTTLPENPADLLIDDNSVRFSSADWFNEIQQTTVVLAGLGGIGSWVALLLSRLKLQNLVLYDDDVVDRSNLGGQLYGTFNVGRPKVESIAEICRNYSAYYGVLTNRRKFEIGSMTAPVMICGFDNMAARRTFFEEWKHYINTLPVDRLKECLFIDGRLAAESFQVFCIRGDDTYSMDKYINEYWFPDEEADETVCSYKQTSYMANMIGSTMVNLLVNHASNLIVEDMRSLPFLTAYNGTTMLFKTQD